jgi:hypothetical protein
VYAGIDPVTGKPNYLTASTHDQKEADRILRRLLSQVDEQNHPRTKITLGEAIDAWLAVHDADANTLAGYETHARLYVKPALGKVALSKIEPQVIERLYADLRRCRLRCNGRSFIEHRNDEPHDCRVVRHRRPPGRRPAGGYPPHDCEAMLCTVVECKPHVCSPLSPSAIRQVHATLSGALSAAVRWGWIRSNPSSAARKPRAPAPEPDPPSATHHSMRPGSRTMTGAPSSGWSWSPVCAAPKRSPCDELARTLHIELTDQAYLFSHDPDRSRPYHPSSVTHRYTAMCAKLGIDRHLHALRHYSATELLTAGVDLRTVAGRLGHAGGGATTLRVYAAWVSESDKRAAAILGSRMQRRQN